jgi:hypothetical protein
LITQKHAKAFFSHKTAIICFFNAHKRQRGNKFLEFIPNAEKNIYFSDDAKVLKDKRGTKKKNSLNVKNSAQNEKWRIIYMQRATALRTFHLISSSCCSLS